MGDAATASDSRRGSAWDACHRLTLRAFAETATGDTWRNLHHELDRMHLVTLATSDGQVAQRSRTTPGQQQILTALQLPEPPRFFDFTLTTEDTQPPADS